jgi:signal transduction histidine kinase
MLGYFLTDVQDRLRGLPPLRPPAILSPLPQSAVASRYIVGFASAVLAIVLRAALEPIFGHAGFYATIYIAVVFSALVCGLGPSILTTVLGTVGVIYWFVDPRYSLLIANRGDVHSLIACLVVCPVLIVLADANRRKRLEINAAHDLLDQRVQERTAELAKALTNLEAEITVRKTTEEQLRRLSLHLMSVQDEERRRIARDLHDSAGQTLAAIKMSLALLQGSISQTSETVVLLNDLDALAAEALQEIRTTSYLLHPPMLDEAGFGSAARWFVDGFTKRSGIEVQCNIPDLGERLSPQVELILFRILQEALTNVHRHSGATAAAVTLSSDGRCLRFELRDNGHGIPEQHLKRLNEADGTGVGIAGMRERIRELGGEMSIQSSKTGTTMSFTFSQPKALHASNQMAT